MEEQLRQERGARQQAEAQLQQELATLEKAQATLKLRDKEVMRLNGELNQLSVSYKDQRQACEEKGSDDP
jgi:hypothetical protein